MVLTGVFAAVSASTAAAVPPMSDLYALSPSGTGLRVTDGGQITSVAGVYVNSDSSQAAVLTDGSEVTVTNGLANIVGNYRLTDGSSFSPAANTGRATIPDPLSGFPTPTIGTSSGPVSVTKGLASLSPGTYSSVSVTGGTLTLSPGVYVITGGVKVSGSGQLTDNGGGVLLYFAPGAGFALSGDSSVSLTPEASPSEYASVSVYFARTSTATFSSTGTVNPDQRHISGAVYVPAGARWMLRNLTPAKSSPIT
jgi:hypothetical protein